MRPRLSYANVMATIAVFIALGGASYAAIKLPKNSVGSKQLKKNAVTGVKVKNEAITAAKIKKGTLTGTQINASTLGTVPKAQAADTSKSADSSTTAQVANTLTPPEPWHEVGAPGEPQFENGCKNADSTYGEAPAGFYKDAGGVVHLEGLYECSGGPIGFQLPQGFRPKYLQLFPLVGSPEHVRVYPGIEPEGYESYLGAVRCQGEPLCFLNGITFRAES